MRDGFRILPEIIRFGLKMTPGTMAQGLANQSPTWLLGLLSTVSAVGAFNRAQALTMRFQDLTSKITEMLFPTLVARRAAGDGHGFDRALIDTMRYSTVVMLLIASVGGGGAFAIMDLFGPGFAPAAPAFAILVLLPALTTVSVIQAYALYAVDRPGLASFIQSGGCVVTVVVGFVLVRRSGSRVRPSASSPARRSTSWSRRCSCARTCRGPGPQLWTPRQMFASVVAYGAGFFAARDVHAMLPELAALPLVLAAGALAYGLVFVLIGGFNDRDWGRLEPVTGTVVRRMQGTVPQRTSRRNDDPGELLRALGAERAGSRAVGLPRRDGRRRALRPHLGRGHPADREASPAHRRQGRLRRRLRLGPAAAGRQVLPPEDPHRRRRADAGVHEKARELLERHNLSEGANVRQGDLFEVDLPENHYDALYSSRVIHYIDEKETLCVACTGRSSRAAAR